MSENKAKVLLIVEGAKTDKKLMKKLFDIYGISATHSIVSYNTNIYTLYKKMFEDNAPEDMDIQNVLLSSLKEEDPHNADSIKILKDNYSDIILIFDLDPQDPEFSREHIEQMQDYFSESTDMGKLYINYPMVEAFYHMGVIPDETFYERIVNAEDIPDYKTTVSNETVKHDYRKFAVDKSECDHVIKQNIAKAYMLINNRIALDTKVHYNDIADKESDILKFQLNELETHSFIYVLCCCVFYICSYNPKLVYD